MSEITNTVTSWFDTSEERRSTAIGVASLGILWVGSQGYQAITTAYPDDANVIIMGGTLTALMTGMCAVWYFGKRAGQRQEPIIIDPDEIREVIERDSDIVEDGVVDVVDGEDEAEDGVENDVETEIVNHDDFDQLMSDLKNKMFHLFLPSTSGSGKTVLIHHFLETQLDEKDSYIILNGKIEGNDTLKFPRSRFTTNEPKEYSKVLGKVVDQMKKREENSTYKYPKLYVVIDESSLLDSDSMDLVVELLSRSRSANIKVILMTQSISVKINGTEGISDILNRITILNLGFDDKNNRVISYARITSGKIKNIGQSIRVPRLSAPWDIDLEFRDDTSTFDFGNGTDTSIMGRETIIEEDVTTIAEPIPQQKSNADAITEFALMLSKKSGVDLSGVVEEHLSGVQEVVTEELSSMLTPRTKEDEAKYDFQPGEYNDKNVPPLAVTVGIIKNGNLQDSGMEKIGDMIITLGDVAAIKYLNTVFGDSNHRKQISVLVFGTHSRYHYSAISKVLGDK